MQAANPEQSIFLAALELPTPAERAAYLKGVAARTRPFWPTCRNSSPPTRMATDSLTALLPTPPSMNSP
jgi:hypothetical protein